MMSALKPVWKKCRLMKSTGMVRSSWVSAEINVFSVPTKMPGTGSPIICPMAMYMRGIRMMMEETSLVFIAFWFCRVRSCRSCHSLLKPLFPFAVPCASARSTGEAP